MPAPKPDKTGDKTKQIPDWQALLHNQFVMALDFKTTFDHRGDTLFVLNIIDHGQRVLHWSLATYNPTSAWVAQQLRNAFMDLDQLPLAMVMDRDSIFTAIVAQTQPAMGIRPIRTPPRCP